MKTDVYSPAPPTTRERLIREGLRLFSERGFRGTTVGDIEAAAGLVPRRGALYKHFRNKRDLLEAALERHIHELQSMSGVMDLLPLGDVRAELTLLVKWLLVELDRERDIILIFEKEGAEFPDLRDRFYEQIGDFGFRQASELARRLFKEAPALGDIDIDTLAAVAVGGLVCHRRAQWTFGRAPLDLEDERFAAGVVDLVVRLMQLAEGSESK
jgi:AcrR family transcriptional regulator